MQRLWVVKVKIINLGNRVVNNYILETNDGYILIDTGYENNYKAFIKRMSEEKIVLDEIKYIFLTLAHDDHAGFLNELLHHTKAKVVLHPKAIEGLRRGQNSFAGGCSSWLALMSCKIMTIMGKGEHKFPKIESQFETRYIAIDSDKYVGMERDMPFKVFETPGHTSCSISMLLNNGILFCGDAAMNGIPSIKRVTIWIESIDDFRLSWQKIIALAPKSIYPAHGKPFSVTDLEKYISSLTYLRTYSLK